MTGKTGVIKEILSQILKYLLCLIATLVICDTS